ncbi:MAG: CHAP domain-containing protein [Spirochaetes bacterium]|nr:CHAP domain-containing protein [Spirochaetota bacterium]
MGGSNRTGIGKTSSEVPFGGQVLPIPSKSVVQKRIVEAAKSLLGRTQLTFEKASFPSDCSGFVLAAYYLGGVDLRKEYDRHEGNGVRRLYQIALFHRLVFTEHPPSPGDVLFWDNTYDANGDGKWNDELTHTGIVVASYSDGKIEYIHYHVRRGIVQERMDLRHPNEEAFNAPIRIKELGTLRSEKWLASQLYRASGRLWALGKD